MKKSGLKRLLGIVPVALAAALMMTACGDGEDKEKDEDGGKPTVESYESDLAGNTFEGSNGVTYAFDDGKVTMTQEGKDDKSGTYSIAEYDSDNDGENDKIALRITASGKIESFDLEGGGSEITLMSGNTKTILTKK